MDYEKAYKEALKRAKGFKTDEYKDVAEYIFPELAESEDEKIRKNIVFYIAAHHKDDGEKARWLYWLEKQGEQKPAEWSAYDKATLEYIIEDIKELCDSETDESSIEAYERELNLLQAINESTKLSNYTNPAEWSEEDEKMCNDTINFIETGWTDNGKSHLIPWLKSLKDRVQPQPKQEILEKLKEWLDEYVSDLADVDTASLICSFTNYLDGKLPKSLRPQNKQEWLGATKEQIYTIAEYLDDVGQITMAEILYGIHLHNHWKPSDEQMKALDDVISSRYIRYDVLSELWKDLNKLK